MGTLLLQFAALEFSPSLEGIALGLRGTSASEVKEGLKKIVKGALISGPTLARLAPNQLEEKYDWALNPDLRCINYASRHLDEDGAQKAAIEMLESLDLAEQPASL